MKKYKEIYRNILTLAIPVMLSQLGQVTVQLADNMMVGNYSTEPTPLAASSFANNVFVLGMLFSTGVVMGLTPLVGKAFLKKDSAQIASLLKNALFAFSALGIIMTMILGGVSFLLPYMKQPPAVVEAATPYYWVLVASLFPLLIFSTFKQFLEGIGNTKVAMIITLSTNAVNIFLNYLLIYGSWGAPEMGLMGAGIATLASRVIMPFAIIIYFKKSLALAKIWEETKNSVIEKAKLVKLMNIGIPIGSQVSFEVLIFSLAGIMMGWLGENEMAAHQAALSVTTASYMISLGVGSAATIRVSHALGLNDFARIRRIIIATLHITVAIMGTMGIIFIIFRHQLPLLFSQNADVVIIASKLFIVAALFQVFDSAQVALLACLRGITDVKGPMVLAFVSYMCIGIPVSYFCTFSTSLDPLGVLQGFLGKIALGLGPVGIWLGLLAGLGSAAILFGIRINNRVNMLESEYQS